MKNLSTTTSVLASGLLGLVLLTPFSVSGQASPSISCPGANAAVPSATLLRCADQGDARAQYRLGVHYARGRGVREDDVEAVRWYRLAAGQGLGDAQYALGYMYGNGDGVSQDDAEAVRWYRLAAEQGNAFGQNALGAMYGDGRGVPEDDVAAVAWYQLAAEQGNESAQANLAQLYSRDEVGSGEVSPGDSASLFVTVTLPKGVSLELPRNWIVISASDRITLDAATQGRLDLSSIELPSSLSFAANLYSDANNQTIALMNLRFYPDLGLSQFDADAATATDVAEIDAGLREGVEASGVSVISWEGTTLTSVNGLHVFLTEYRRRSVIDQAPWTVRLVRVFAEEQSFTLTISRADRLEYVLEPIVDRVIASIALDGVVPPSGPQASPSPMKVLFGEQWQIALLLSLVLTWGIGLAPPLLIRFVILRRPLGNPAAVGLAGSFFLFNVVLFMALGSQSRTHTGLVLVALASYAILRRGAPRDEKESSRASHSDGAGLRADGESDPDWLAVRIRCPSCQAWIDGRADACRWCSETMESE